MQGVWTEGSRQKYKIRIYTEVLSMLNYKSLWRPLRLGMTLLVYMQPEADNGHVI